VATVLTILPIIQLSKISSYLNSKGKNFVWSTAHRPLNTPMFITFFSRMYKFAFIMSMENLTGEI